MSCGCQVETAKKTILRLLKFYPHGWTLGGLSEATACALGLAGSSCEEAKIPTWHALEELIKDGVVFKREEKAHFFGTTNVYYLNNRHRAKSA